MCFDLYIQYQLKHGGLGWARKYEEPRREFNSILEYATKGALDLEIHQVEESVYRRLLGPGRILPELFILAVGTGKAGEVLIGARPKGFT